MKRILLFVLLFAAAGKGFNLYNKYRHAKRLKVGVEGFKLQNFSLSSLITDVEASVQIGITNFSDSVFRLNQIKVDVYTQSGELLAEQIEPLRKSQTILSNQKSVLPLSFTISPNKLTELIRQSGGAANVGANFLINGNYGIPIIIKGEVEAEGINLKINEKIVV